MRGRRVDDEAAEAWRRQTHEVMQSAARSVEIGRRSNIIDSVCDGPTCAYSVWSEPWYGDHPDTSTIIQVATRDYVPVAVPMIRYMGIWQPSHGVSRKRWNRLGFKEQIRLELNLQIEWAKHTFWYAWLEHNHVKIAGKIFQEKKCAEDTLSDDPKPWLGFSKCERMARQYARRLAPELISLDVTERRRT